MSSLIGRRAVIIGAGIGGLSAAGVLAPCFGQIITLERDRVTPAAEARSRVPQGRHSHGLLVGGLKALKEIFPGDKRALVEAGAVPWRLRETSGDGPAPSGIWKSSLYS